MTENQTTRDYIECQARVSTAMAIKHAIEEKGVTQKWLANQMQVTQGAVSRWCTGVNMPDIGKLAVLAYVLKIPFEQLIKGVGKNDK